MPTAWVTLTNQGYALYTLNMLKSLAQFGLDRNVLVVCLDAHAEDIFQARGYRTSLQKCEHQQFCAWNTKGYDEICYLKLVMVHQLLEQRHNVLLLDGDLVFLNDPSAAIATWEENSTDVWIQNDAQKDDDTMNLCTGFMFIKSTPHMTRLYNCLSESGREKYKRCAFNNNDQTYFNNYIKPYCRVNALPLAEYPNGKMFYEHPEILPTAVLVHFNWVRGHEKMARMKQHRMWLLTEEEEA